MGCPGSACNQKVAKCTDGKWEWVYSTVCPVCASPDTPIATPEGDRSIADLNVGDLVYSVDGDAIRSVPILRVGRTPVLDHRIVRVRLAGGRTLEISAGRPTADGRTFAALKVGATLDGAVIDFVETIPYSHSYTYDILPASTSGDYFAGGLRIGSTLTGRP
jgi:hypothetical protein